MSVTEKKINHGSGFLWRVPSELITWYYRLQAGRAWTWNPLTAFHFLEYRASKVLQYVVCRVYKYEYGRHSNRPLLTLLCSRCSGALSLLFPSSAPLNC